MDLLEEQKHLRTPFPKSSKQILSSWLSENKARPFATYKIINDLANQTGLTCVQVSDWLKYERKKLKKEGLNKHDKS